MDSEAFLMGEFICLDQKLSLRNNESAAAG